MILGVRGDYFAGGLRARINVRPEWRERYFAVFLNGRYVETRWADVAQDLSVTLPIGPDDSISSFWLEDLGLLADPDEDTIQALGIHSRQAEAATADKIVLTWDNADQYRVSAINYGTGALQLSSLVVTGARRNLNVEALPELPQRGRLYFSNHQRGRGGDLHCSLVRWKSHRRGRIPDRRRGDHLHALQQFGPDHHSQPRIHFRSPQGGSVP